MTKQDFALIAGMIAGVLFTLVDTALGQQPHLLARRVLDNAQDVEHSSFDEQWAVFCETQDDCNIALSAHAVITPQQSRRFLQTSSSIDECKGVETGRNGCWNRGFFDHLTSWEQCKIACEMDKECNSFHWGSARGDRRCHLCTWHGSLSAGSSTDYWGPAVCEGDERVDITLAKAVEEMAAFCTAPVKFDNLKHLRHARALQMKLRERDELLKENAGFAQELADAADTAATALNKITSGACAAQPTPCNSGLIAMHLLRTILAVVDNSASRAFRDSPERRVMFDKHRVFVADGMWLNQDSMNSMMSFFDSLPEHLMTRGVQYDAPFATLTVKDAHKCNADPTVTSYLEVTKRGFNIFQTQAGERTEDAFAGTGQQFSLRGDLYMTVVRHEVAHQFDRVIQRDSNQRLQNRFSAIKRLAKTDRDWCRVIVGNDYFQRSPQEIIASQVGNQYLLSSSNQLRMALARLKRPGVSKSALPLAWVLFHIELFADQGGSGAFSSGQGPATSTFFEAEDRLGNVVPICVGFDRIEGSGLITELRLPGCPPLRFMYGITQMSDPNALNIGIAPEDWDCVPSTEPSDAVCQGTGTTTHTAAPTTTTTAAPATTTTAAPTTTHTAAPTTTHTAAPATTHTAAPATTTKPGTDTTSANTNANKHKQLVQ